MLANEIMREFGSSFVHRRIFGAATGAFTSLITGGNPAIGAFRGATAPVTISGADLAARGLTVGGANCKGGTPIWDGTRCITRDAANALVGPTQVPTGTAPQGMVGEAVMGRYGAALVPTQESRITHTCLPGMVLGNDGLCYNRRDITNRERKYPKGRAPLLTGGERNAITKAARAAKKIERTQKQLVKLGMLKKPGRRAAAPRAAPHRHGAPAGTSIINVE